MRIWSSSSGNSPEKRSRRCRACLPANVPADFAPGNLGKASALAREAHNDGPNGDFELPSITVITPTFNAVSTLAETLASIQSQRYPSLDHLVIDGGSSDGTVELLRAEADAGRLRFVSEPDDGLTDAFNKGLRMAEGDVIGWLNADDVYASGALLAVGRAFAAAPEAEWATGRCRIIGADGHESRRPVTAYKNLLLRRFSLPLYLTNNFVSSPATFVRRAVVDQVGPLDRRFKYSADYDYWLRFAKRSRPLLIDAELASFRMGEGSLSITGFRDQFREHAQNAREHGAGHPFAVAINSVLSRLIVLAYECVMFARRMRR